MRNLNTCFEIANSFYLDETQSRQFISENVARVYYKPKIEDSSFVTGAELFSIYQRKIESNFPGQEGDIGIYWLNKKHVLGMTSFNLNNLEDSCDIVQIQGSRFENLTSNEKKAIKNLPWEICLIKIVEAIAKLSKAKKARIIPYKKLGVNAEYTNRKSLAIRYDISAINSGYFPSEDNWYEKPLVK